MAFTKIVGAGIHTLSNVHTHNVNSSGIITATSFVGPFNGSDGDFSGNVTIDGNLTVNGNTTTLDTTLQEVDQLFVSANNTSYAGIITQTGSGNILGLFDGSTRVFNVADGGAISTKALTVTGDIEVVDSTPRIKITDSDATGNAYAAGNNDNPLHKIIRTVGGVATSIAATDYIQYGGGNIGGAYVQSVMDTAQSTAAHEYKIQIRSDLGNNTVYFNVNDTNNQGTSEESQRSTIMVMEIAQ